MLLWTAFHPKRHPNHPDLEEIRAMGYTDCYIKPVRVQTFREKVDQMMTAASGG